MPPIRLGDLLLKAKAITDAQLQAALAEQQRWGGKLGEILVRMEALTEEMLVKALSKQLGLPAVNLEPVQGIAQHVRAKVPAQTAKELTLVPLQLRDDGKTLVVAMAEPQNIQHVDSLRAVTKCRIMVQVAGRTAITKAIARFYDEMVEPPPGTEGSFKLIDAQGHSVSKARPTAAEPPLEIERPLPRMAEQSSAPPGLTKKRAASSDTVPVAAAAPASSALKQLELIEQSQRKEVQALKAMVELLIEKGVFTRDEYLSRVKR